MTLNPTIHNHIQIHTRAERSPHLSCQIRLVAASSSHKRKSHLTSAHSSLQITCCIKHWHGLRDFRFQMSCLSTVQHTHVSVPFSFPTSCGSCSWEFLRGGSTPAPHPCRTSFAPGMFSPRRAVRKKKKKKKRRSLMLAISDLPLCPWRSDELSWTDLNIDDHPGSELLRDDDGEALFAAQS